MRCSTCCRASVRRELPLVRPAPPLLAGLAGPDPVGRRPDLRGADGTDDNPAVEGFDPGVGADLYTTNGEFTDWAHGVRDVLAWTPELSEGCEDCGFVFPDDEALVQAEFERNLEFALNVARPPSRRTTRCRTWTSRPRTSTSTSRDRPVEVGEPVVDLRVDVSYGGGSSQSVDVLAKRSVRRRRP